MQSHYPKCIAPSDVLSISATSSHFNKLYQKFKIQNKKMGEPNSFDVETTKLVGWSRQRPGPKCDYIKGRDMKSSTQTLDFNLSYLLRTITPFLSTVFTLVDAQVKHFVPEHHMLWRPKHLFTFPGGFACRKMISVDIKLQRTVYLKVQSDRCQGNLDYEKTSSWQWYKVQHLDYSLMAGTLGIRNRWNL